MPYDFPSNPTNGQTVTLGSTTWQWNGVAWIAQSGNIGPTGPQGPTGATGPQGPKGDPGVVGEAPTTGLLYARRGSDGTWQEASAGVACADTPPIGAADKSLWWETDSAALFIRYDNTWVQVNSPGVMFPPSDGNEYVMRNGVWRLKSQTLDFTNVAQVDVAVPAGAKLVKWAGNLLQASASAQYITARVSADGSTFLSAASDYNYAGWIHGTGTNGFQNYPAAAQSSILMTLSQNDATVAHTFTGQLQLTRPASNTIGFFGKGENYNYNTSTALLFQTSQYHIWVNGSSTSLTGITALKALRFMSGSLTNWLAGSIDLEWVY